MWEEYSITKMTQQPVLALDFVHFYVSLGRTRTKQLIPGQYFPLHGSHFEKGNLHYKVQERVPTFLTLRMNLVLACWLRVA